MKDCKSCSCVDPGTCVECLKGQLERYKEALRLAIRDLHKLNHYCPAGIFYTCKDTTKTCFECLERYYLDKAKGGQ